MAFVQKNFHPIGPPAGRGHVPVHWAYRTTDAASVVAGAGYFSAVKTLLEIGDVIVVSIVDSLSAPTSVTSTTRFIITDSSAGTGVEETEDIERDILTVDMTDISSAASVWVVAPRAGTIENISSVINGAITVGDAVITAKIATVGVTNGVITIANAGSAAGTVDTVTPTALDVVTAGQAIELSGNGGSTDVSRATFTITIRRS